MANFQYLKDYSLKLVTYQREEKTADGKERVKTAPDGSKFVPCYFIDEKPVLTKVKDENGKLRLVATGETDTISYGIHVPLHLFNAAPERPFPAKPGQKPVAGVCKEFSIVVESDSAAAMEGFRVTKRTRIPVWDMAANRQATHEVIDAQGNKTQELSWAYGEKDTFYFLPENGVFVTLHAISRDSENKAHRVAVQEAPVTAKSNMSVA